MTSPALVADVSLNRTYPAVKKGRGANGTWGGSVWGAEAHAGRIEKVTGVPVVTLTYDGTGAPQNDTLVPYLAAARQRLHPAEGPRAR